MQEVILRNIEQDFRSNEAYKTLRTNIEFAGADKKVIILTSSAPNEGTVWIFFMQVSFRQFPRNFSAQDVWKH